MVWRYSYRPAWFARGVNQAWSHQGQATTETILMLPVYLLIVFGLLQACQLGVGLIVMNYAASSIAQMASEEMNFNVTTPFDPRGTQGQEVGGIRSRYLPKLAKWKVVGMSNENVRGCAGVNPGSTVTANLSVWTSARIGTFPFLRQLLHVVLGSSYAYDDTSAASCQDNNKLGPFYFAADGSYWVVRGKAIVRLNYQGQ